jgi:hypothetical protein
MIYHLKLESMKMLSQQRHNYKNMSLVRLDLL